MARQDIPLDESLKTSNPKINENFTELYQHAEDTANPHGVTAAQTGALTQAEADLLYKTIGYVPAWAEITGKPATFPPEFHSHKRLLGSSLYAIPSPTTYTQTISAAGGATQISGGVQHFPDHPAFRYRGGDTYVGTNTEILGTGNSHTFKSEHFEVECMYDGAAIEFRERAIAQLFVPMIDNVQGTMDSSMPSDGQFYRRKIDFGSRKIRRIRIRTNSLHRIVIEGDATIWPVPIPAGRRVMVMGDSYTEPEDSWAVHTGLICAEDAWKNGQGGTGILADGGAANGKTKFRDRVSTDVAPYAPDIVIVAGGINDNDSTKYTAAQFRAEYDLLLSDLQEQIPGVQIVCVGPFFPSEPGSFLISLRDEAKASAAAAGASFVDGFVFTSANNPRYIGADGTHPNSAGQEYLGRRVGGEIAAKLYEVQ